MAIKGEENLIPFSERTEEEQRKIARQGGIASGKARKKKAIMRDTLKKLLKEKSTTNGKTYRELATLGLIKGAINGNAQNYRTILETLGELKDIQEDKVNYEMSKVEELLSKIENEANK